MPWGSRGRDRLSAAADLVGRRIKLDWNRTVDPERGRPTYRTCVWPVGERFNDNQCEQQRPSTSRRARACTMRAWQDCWPRAAPGSSCDCEGYLSDASKADALPGLRYHIALTIYSRVCRSEGVESRGRRSRLAFTPDGCVAAHLHGAPAAVAKPRRAPTQAVLRRATGAGQRDKDPDLRLALPPRCRNSRPTPRLDSVVPCACQTARA